jgi:S1-C subfamily serine protease
MFGSTLSASSGRRALSIFVPGLRTGKLALLTSIALYPFGAPYGAAAQGSNDINAIIRKAPQGGRVDLRSGKAPEVEKSPEAGKETAKAGGGMKSLGYNEISDLGKSATVLILITDGAGEHSLGSGFFISKTLVFTNSHVVSESSKIDVIRSDGSHHAGKVISLNAQKGGKDFAILELKDSQQPVWFKFSTNYEPLMPVYAFGFPYVAIADDPNFTAIAKGDVRALPHIVASSGAIQQVRENDLNAQVIMHSAKIAGGNSGGPLVDACGRVLGVNTYTISAKSEIEMKDGSKGEASVDTGYAFSISSEEIKKFLDSRGTKVAFETEKCGL